jgi:hypothetical protein
MREGGILESLIREYEAILQTLGTESAGAKQERGRLVEALHASGDWSEQGAAQIVQLVDDHGAFMLRNALALAVVLGKEDGDLGF